MTAAQLRIMVRAAQIRLAQGETIDTVLDAWPALSEADKVQIRAAVGAVEGGAV